ncbi:hypothetical protein JTE90_013015 [Oedothorax gibbosus]|uniref:Uncharacterized protein n=1 Tax=Oedothorax gibbosus TaxID=931172 RepID=A0AAV6UME4_9ARAC|nr:hypothetical protein JTE90_013015 [Oedothorax gibbosus]
MPVAKRPDQIIHNGFLSKRKSYTDLSSKDHESRERFQKIKKERKKNSMGVGKNGDGMLFLFESTFFSADKKNGDEATDICHKLRKNIFYGWKCNIGNNGDGRLSLTLCGLLGIVLPDGDDLNLEKLR